MPATRVEYVRCPACNGTGGGYHPAEDGGAEIDICGYCRGEGRVEEDRYRRDYDPGPPEHDD